MNLIAKYFIYFGIIFLLIGSFVYFTGKLGINFGKLPGDIVVQKNNFTFYFPLATSILISIVLTIILNLIFRK